MQKQRKKRNKFNFFAYFVLTALFLSSGLFFPQTVKETQAQTSQLNVRGWAWSYNYGWVELSCPGSPADPSSYDCTSGGFNPPYYGVTIDPATGIMGGFAWSSNIGWISFDYEENTKYGGSPPFDPTDPNNYLNPQGYDPMQDPASPCNSSTPCTAWFDENDTFVVGGVTYGKIKGWARVISLRDDGDPNTEGWLRLRGLGDTAEYGVGINFSSGENNLRGYGWSQASGTGWLDFLPSGGGVSYRPPYVETAQGDIYARAGVGTEQTFVPPAGNFNAAYLIQSGGDVINFCTAAGTEYQIYCAVGGADTSEYLNLGETAYPDPFSPPLATNRYTNVMGKLDLEGLIGYEGSYADDILNKFGNAVKEYGGDQSSSDIWSSGDVKLSSGLAHNKGRVYHFLGNLTVDSALTILKGDSVNNPNAAGTIVVDGDLYINKDIFYDSAALVSGDTLIDIPSIAWIVKGSVIVDSGVANIVGAFIAVGKPDSNDPHSLAAGTGEFHSGGGEVKLDVSGMVIANEIDLERSYVINTMSNTIEPAESITYDGRAIVNTPPGLSDFAAALPVLREVAPIEAIP